MSYIRADGTPSQPEGTSKKQIATLLTLTFFAVIGHIVLYDNDLGRYRSVVEPFVHSLEEGVNQLFSQGEDMYVDEDLEAALDDYFDDINPLDNPIFVLIDNPRDEDITVYLDDEAVVVDGGTFAYRDISNIETVRWSRNGQQYEKMRSELENNTLLNPTFGLYVLEQYIYGDEEDREQAKIDNQIETYYICLGGKKYFGFELVYSTGAVRQQERDYDTTEIAPDTLDLEGLSYRLINQLWRKQDFMDYHDGRRTDPRESCSPSLDA